MTPRRRRELVLLRRARDRIHRCFADALDVPAPAAYLTTRGIERAAALLQAGWTVTDACRAVGFSSLGSFSSRFRRAMVTTPSAHRIALIAERGLPGCTLRMAARVSRNGEAAARDAAQRAGHAHLPALLPRPRRGRRGRPPSYRDGLGPPVAHDVRYGDARRVTLGGPSGAQPVLSGTADDRSPEDGEALEQLVVKGAPGPRVFLTEDLEAAFRALTDGGAEVVEEPADQLWGPRECASRDPSGDLVRLQQA